MTERMPSHGTESALLPAEHNDSLQVKTEIFLLRKNSLTLKLTLKGKKSITVDVFACRDVTLSVAITIARVQEQLVKAEALCYQGPNFLAHLLMILDKQGWAIQSQANSD